MFNLKVAKNKFSFEPDLRFSLAAKPWVFLFWFRYSLVTKNKFLLRIGVQPAVNFKEQSVLVNSISKNVIIARRYFATEISPTYFLNKNNSIGMYYLLSKGVDDGAIKTTQFITLNYALSNIKIYKQFLLKFAPQFYYLKLDANDGVYFTSTFTVQKKQFPLSISSVINKTIHSNSSGKTFLWNISLNYAFN